MGGTNPTDGVGGKRHPTICDDAIISLGAAILGPITIGEGARIGANSVVTKDVPAGATMVGIPARSTLVEVKDETPKFTPYGTPCSERFDPKTQSLELLQCEVESLQKKIAEMVAHRDATPKPAKSVTKMPAKKPRKAPSKKPAAKRTPAKRKAEGGERA